MTPNPQAVMLDAKTLEVAAKAVLDCTIRFSKAHSGQLQDQIDLAREDAVKAIRALSNPAPTAGEGSWESRAEARETARSQNRQKLYDIEGANLVEQSHPSEPDGATCCTRLAALQQVVADFLQGEFDAGSIRLKRDAPHDK